MLRLSALSAIVFGLSLGLNGVAWGRSAEESLLRLEPKTMMMQVCDIRLVKELRQDKRYKGVDRAMVDAMSRPVIEDNVVRGEGGAFRLKGEWVRFSFECVLEPDHLTAASMTYEVGEKIPEDKWETYGLWR